VTAAVAEYGLADHPFSEAIKAQLPLDVWDLGVFGYAGGAMTARFKDRADRAGRGATGITQQWLLGAMKEWVLRNALRKVSSSYIDDMILSVAMLSATLRERSDSGDHPDRLSRNDIAAHLLRLGRLRESGLISLSGQQRAVRFVAHLLDDIRKWGLTARATVAQGLPDSFAVHRTDCPKITKRAIDEPSRALPRTVVRQLLQPEALQLLVDQAGSWAAAWFKIALGTGRRPGELTRLPMLGCLDQNTYRDDAGVDRHHFVLVHDMSKVGIVGYRLPITDDLAKVIKQQQDRVQCTYPDSDPSRLPLFPAPFHNPDGLRPVPTWQIAVIVRNWVSALPQLLAPDTVEDDRAGNDAEHATVTADPIDQPGTVPFPRSKVYPYALRHTWAQDHADAGTPLEVLQDLLGHAKPVTTQGYYRMTHARRRAAVVRLSRLQLTSTGSLVTAGLRVLESEDNLRGQVGSVAVPFGMCTEPSNVQAGGHSCPYRMKCLGCNHFRTDPSYLPELGEYLTQLLVARERLITAGNQVEPWAIRSAMPSDEEIDRVRHLISRCENALSSLTEEERAEIKSCISQVRTARGHAAQIVPLQLSGNIRINDPDIFPANHRRQTQHVTGTVR